MLILFLEVGGIEFTIKEITIPNDVSTILFHAKYSGFVSLSWVIVTHKKTTHIRAVPFFVLKAEIGK